MIYVVLIIVLAVVAAALYFVRGRRSA